MANSALLRCHVSALLRIVQYYTTTIPPTRQSSRWSDSGEPKQWEVREWHRKFDSDHSADILQYDDSPLAIPRIELSNSDTQLPKVPTLRQLALATIDKHLKRLPSVARVSTSSHSTVTAWKQIFNQIKQEQIEIEIKVIPWNKWPFTWRSLFHET